jgi:hypothetical protein
LRDCLLEPDRQRHILIRGVGKGFRHKAVSRDAQQGGQDSLFERRFPFPSRSA